VNHFASEGRCFIDTLLSIPEKILQIKQAFRLQDFNDVFAPALILVVGFFFRAFVFSYCLCTSF